MFQPDTKAAVAMTTGSAGAYRLITFVPRHAPIVARWAETDEELLWLAPSTQPPLTAAKVGEWLKRGGHAFSFLRAEVGGQRAEEHLVGYAELNPMRNTPDHLWIGHVVVRPDMRGKGVGRTLLRALVNEAFGSLGATRLSLVVFPDNIGALRCYAAVGLRMVGEECHRFGGIGPKRRLLRYEMTAPVVRAEAVSSDSAFGEEFKAP